MKAKSERFLLVVGVLAVFVTVGAIGFKAATEGRREAALAKLKKAMPVTHLDRMPGHSAGQGSNPSDRTDQTDRSDSIARFAQLFERTKDTLQSEKWAERLQKPEKEWADAEWEQVRAELAGMQDLIRAIRELADRGGRPANLDLSKGFDTDLSHLAKLRNLARLLSLDALTQARGGSSEEAVQDLLAIMKLADCLVDEPLIISQLVRIAMDTYAYDTARAAFPSGGLSPEQVGSLVGYAGQGDHREAFSDGLYGEGEFVLSEFERIRQGGSVEHILNTNNAEASSSVDGTLESLITAIYQGDRRAITHGAYGMAVAEPWRAMDETTYASFIPAIVDASRLPYYQALPRMEQIGRDIESLPMTRVVSRNSLPILTHVIGAQARVEAMLDLMQLGLSVDQYYAQNGSYPASLNAVASDLGGTLPVDPFTGQPYLYRVSDGGYSLYSVGRNLVDDGGRDDYNRGDIVWRTQQNTAPKSVVSPDKKAKTIAMR